MPSRHSGEGEVDVGGKRTIKRRKKPADKQRVPKRDKILRQAQDKSRTTNGKSVSRETSVEALSEQAQAALKLLDQETADGIIGSPDDDYNTLIKGSSAVLS